MTGLQFPLNNGNYEFGGILIRNLEDVYTLEAMIPGDFDFGELAKYPEYRHAKHFEIVRLPDGTFATASSFATEAAIMAAGETLGLLDMGQDFGVLPTIDGGNREDCPAVIYGKAAHCSYWLQTPRTLNPDEVFIHRVVDPNTGTLHPFYFDVTNVKANAIGKVSDFMTVNNYYGTTCLVHGCYHSQYYLDKINT